MGAPQLSQAHDLPKAKIIIPPICTSRENDNTLCQHACRPFGDARCLNLDSVRYCNLHFRDIQPTSRIIEGVHPSIAPTKTFQARLLKISYATCQRADKMSMLPPEVQTTLTQLLQALSSGDNALRSQAEEQLNNDWTANRPDILLMGLVEQIQGAQDAAVFLVISD